ncbi:competence protein ComEA [Geomicrobium halophilum]|uniref:Competence protein ComEA n=1 Tax=Geomicrobium halophilum TaxID=549000 RepID=A0A841PJA5_9BACL|nr:helix-hairpin-helix domain-containing protein [Geomicrobium halophilum]MBB6448809.1 competence protein ComEA [Geomicrobium halophilum]
MNQRYLLYGGSAIVVLITLFGGVWMLKPSKDVGLDADDERLFAEMENENHEELEKEQEDMQEEEGSIFVDVKGEVANPGIYELETEKRVDDAIRMAGGISEQGNKNGINFAERIQDEMVIYVPHEEEEDVDVWETQAQEGDEGEPINLNEADENTLQQLTGVGPKTAEAIVQFREENGHFQQPGDIQNVSGIGEKTFEQLKDDIVVK